MKDDNMSGPILRTPCLHTTTTQAVKALWEPLFGIMAGRLFCETSMSLSVSLALENVQVPKMNMQCFSV